MFSVIRICLKAIQFCYRRLGYLRKLDNWVEAFLFVSSIIFVSYGLQSGCQCPKSWQWQYGALTLLCAWLDLVLFLKKFHLTGIYVLMFVDILSTFIKMVLLSALFVISFALTFFMIFYRPVSWLVSKDMGMLSIFVCAFAGNVISIFISCSFLG